MKKKSAKKKSLTFVHAIVQKKKHCSFIKHEVTICQRMHRCNSVSINLSIMCAAE